MQTQASQPVKLRLVWRGESVAGAQPKLCFNETLHDVSLAKWRQRVARKCGAVGDFALMYSPTTEAGCLGERAPQLRELVSDADLAQLVDDYAAALKTHRAPSTLRLVVHIVAQGNPSPSDAAPSRPTCSSQPGSLKSCRIDTTAARSGGSANKKLRVFVSFDDVSRSPHSEPQLDSRTNNSSAQVQQSRGMYHHLNSVKAAAAAQPDLFWDRVLHSIIKTIDRHHFGSKLAAATAKPTAASASMA